MLQPRPFVFHVCGQLVGQRSGDDFILAHPKFGRVLVSDFLVEACPNPICRKPINRSNVHEAIDRVLKRA